MADPTSKEPVTQEAPRGVEASEELPRTPRVGIAEGLRKFIGALGALTGIRVLARVGTRRGQQEAQVYSLAEGARAAGVVHGDDPARLVAYQIGAEAALKGEDLAA